MSLLATLAHLTWIALVSIWKKGHWSHGDVVWLVEGYNVTMLCVTMVFLPWANKRGGFGVLSITDAQRPIPPDAIRYFLLNNLFLFLAYLLYDAPVQTSLVQARSLGIMATIWALLPGVFLCYLTFEILEFVLHGLLHTKWMFENVHYLHHQTNALQSITGFYMHPIDTVLQVMIPVFVPLWLWAHDIETIVAFLTLGLFFIYTGHSGYAVPYLFSGRYHYLHHCYPSIHLAAIEPLFRKLKNLKA